MGGAKIPPVRLVHTGLTGVEWHVGSGCVTGFAWRVEPRERHAVRFRDEELGDGDGGGVSGGAEGGAARRGHALAAVWADWC